MNNTDSQHIFVSRAQILSAGKRFLLIVPPIYDYRLPWAYWHQPTGILQISTWLKNQGKDVKLIDCLNNKSRKTPRRKIGNIIIDGYKLDLWHFGIPFIEIKKKLMGILKTNWAPDVVLISSLNSIWWESVRDTIQTIRIVLPNTRIILGGLYPTIDPGHAQEFSGADEIFVGGIPEASLLPPDLSIYPYTPYTSGIYFYNSQNIFETMAHRIPREKKEIIAEIKAKSQLGVREFVIFDEVISERDHDKLVDLFQCIANESLSIHFVFPGNISPKIITRELAKEMLSANVTEVYLYCDIYFGDDNINYTTTLSDYQKCMKILTKAAKFRPREGNVAAMLVVGLPYEDLKQVSERLIHLAHIVGSVIVVPFQYVPGLHKGKIFERVLTQNGNFTPEVFNGKLFPLPRMSGKSFEEYVELIRLATLLNSKYRSKTFDFLGDSLVAKLFRESIKTQGWDPFSSRDENEQEAIHADTF